MEEEDGSPKVNLKLANRKLTDAGNALGLKPGDILIAVNGKSFTGDARALNQRFAVARGRQLALTFVRATAEFTVLANHPALGGWVETNSEIGYDGERQTPELMTNWDIVLTDDGKYDIYPQRPSVMTILCPPFWLMQMRLWAPMAAIAAAIVVSAIIWLPLGAVVWCLAGLHLRSAGGEMVRAERIGRGMVQTAIVAATNETQAHAAYKQLNPDAHFLFAKEPAPKESAEDEAPA